MLRGESGSLERIWRRIWSESRSVWSEFGKLKIGVWDLGKLELGIIVKITCLRGLVFLTQKSDQLGGLFFRVNGELGFSGFSVENGIVFEF